MGPVWRGPLGPQASENGSSAFLVGGMDTTRSEAESDRLSPTIRSLTPPLTRPNRESRANESFSQNRVYAEVNKRFNSSQFVPLNVTYLAENKQHAVSTSFKSCFFNEALSPSNGIACRSCPIGNSGRTNFFLETRPIPE